jgi:K+-sensing histidine kinase KdpD
MILANAASGVSGTEREYLETILENAHRSATLLNNLARLLSQPQLCLESFDVRDLWQESLELLRLQADAKSAKFIARSSPGTFSMMGDRQELLLVFYKLIENALALAGHGAGIEVDFSRSEDMIGIRIADPAAEELSGIMKDAPGAGSAESHSDGSGSAANFQAVHDIVWQHGGTMAVMHSAEHGYIFTMKFPAMDAGDPVVEAL